MIIIVGIGLIICIIFIFYYFKEKKEGFYNIKVEDRRSSPERELLEILENPVTRAEIDEICQIMDENPNLKNKYSQISDVYCPSICYTWLDDINIESAALEQSRYDGFDNSNIIDYITDAKNYVEHCKYPKPDITQTQTYQDFVLRTPIITPPLISGLGNYCNPPNDKEICCLNPGGCDDGTTFINKEVWMAEDRQFQNYDVNQISENIGGLENYCFLGNDLIAEGILLPQNSPQFLKLCCGGNAENCGQAQFECLTNAGIYYDFLNNSQPQDIDRWKFCNSSNYLIQNCGLANPIENKLYNQLCMGEGTSPFPEPPSLYKLSVLYIFFV